MSFATAGKPAGVEDAWVHKQAVGLMMYGAGRYGNLGRGSTEQYLTVLVSLSRSVGRSEAELEVAEMILVSRRHQSSWSSTASWL